MEKKNNLITYGKFFVKYCLPLPSEFVFAKIFLKLLDYLIFKILFQNADSFEAKM